MTYLEFLQNSNVDDMANFIATLLLQTVAKLCKETGMEIDPKNPKMFCR